jgi:hypothetical protein
VPPDPGAGALRPAAPRGAGPPGPGAGGHAGARAGPARRQRRRPRHPVPLSARLPIPRAGRLPALAVAAVALAGLGLAQTDPGREALADLGVAAPSEPYTELALARPDATPRIDDGVVALPVWIHNAEGGARTYTWAATTRAEGGAPLRAATGRVALEDDAERTVPVRVPVACAGDRVRVDVSIGGPHRTVGAWVPCEGTTP